MKNRSTIIQVAALVTVLFVAVAYPITLEQVNTSSPQTLTNKTLTSPTIDGTPTITGVLQGANPLIMEGATDDAFETTISVQDPTADRTHTIPDVASDTFGMVGATQTFTNKTLDDPILTRDAEASLPTSATEGKVIWLDDGPQGLIGDFGSKLAHLFGYNWVADSYSDCNAAIAAIGSTQATLVVQKNCVISATVTAPATLTWKFEGQGQISPAAGTTLTINGPLEAPLRQVFGGAGSVVFGASSTSTVSPLWFNLSESNSALDNSTAISNTISSISKGTVKFPAGTYDVNSFSVPVGVNILGAGVGATIFNHLGSSACITTSSAWLHQRFEDFEITHVNNTNTGNIVDFIDAKHGSVSSIFKNIRLRAKGTVSRDGIKIRGENPDTSTANNNQYNNSFENIRTGTVDTEATGKALYLFGKDITNARANGNDIIGGVYDGFSTGIFINGSGNSILGATINTASFSAIHIQGDSGTYDNTVHAYIDSGVTGNKVRLDSTSASPPHMAFILPSLGINTHSDITRTGTNSTSIAYTLLSRQFISGATGKTQLDPNNAVAQLFSGSDAAGVTHFSGSIESNSGRLLVSGPTYSGGVNAVSNNGGVSVVLNDNASAEHRIVKTSNGVSYTIVSQTSREGDQSLRRYIADKGTNLVVGDFALSAGWGTTASVSSVSGNDMRGKFTVTSNGTGQTANPTITLTFKDGAFTSTPFITVVRNGGDSTSVAFDWIESTTTLIITWRGTPVALGNYTFSFQTLG